MSAGSGVAGALAGALSLLISGDREVFSIAATSLSFSAISTVVSTGIGVPIGALIALRKFPGRRAVFVVLNSLMAVPTVVIGLFFFSFLSRSGPLGNLGLLFTPAAVMIGQSFLALPIVISLVSGALQKTDERLIETLITLGAKKRQVLMTVLWEAKTAVLAAILAGFGRIIGEVGVSMMLGGNIRWYTRTLTTAIALETSKGQFELGLALGSILLILALLINALLHSVTPHER